MADLERRTAQNGEMQDRLCEWLTRDADLADGEVVTGGMLIFATERVDHTGHIQYRRGRSFPLGEVSPTMEMGLIDRAHQDIHDGN